MEVVSSQHYLDMDKVEEKKAEMLAAGTTKITLPCWMIGEVDGKELAILSDGHHRYEAAKELGVEVVFDFDDDPEGLTGENALNVRWMDGDWYYVTTSDVAHEEYDFVW